MNPFSSNTRKTVAAWGETRLISAIQQWLGATSPRSPFGIGDDCAVLPASRHQSLVTTDPVIYGRHFDYMLGASAAGAKLLKRNLSDIAAMGGKPRAAVVALALAPETKIIWLRDFYHGLAATARKHHVKIIGGDITAAPKEFLGAFLTLYGEAAAGRVVTRQGARAGDFIYVTGQLGGTRRGHHYRFEPRLVEGAWLARQPAVRAMMDISDGLAKDVGALTTRGLRPALCADSIPISATAHQQARTSGSSALAHALCDGEDYELLLVVRGARAAKKLEYDWQRRFTRLPLTRIGYFTRARTLPAGTLNLSGYHGYEHLR